MNVNGIGTYASLDDKEYLVESDEDSLETTQEFPAPRSQDASPKDTLANVEQINMSYGTNKDIVDAEDDPPKTASEAFERILRSVGGSGIWQWKVGFVCGLYGFFTAFHNLGAVFLAASPDHWCRIPSLNLTLLESKDLLNFTVPWVINKDGDLDHAKCRYFELDYSNATSKEDFQQLKESQGGNLSDIVRWCHSWYYDTTTTGPTAVSEWDLVCYRRWLMSMTQASYMFGILLGAVIASAFSDKVGRRKSTLACMIIFFLSSLLTAFSTNFEMFLGLRFLTAASGQGMTLINFVLLMEVLEQSSRTTIPIITGCPWIFGSCLLPILAYYLKDWRLLQLVTGASTSLLFIYFRVFPESPRWLLMQSRFSEGIEILEQMAKANGGKLPPTNVLNQYLSVISGEGYRVKKQSRWSALREFAEDLMTLVRTPNLRRRNLTIFYCWFVVSSVFYGLTFSGYNINASSYKLVFFTSLIAVPIIPIKIVLLKRFGRRITMASFFTLCGLSCLAILAVPNEHTWINLSLVILGTGMSGGAFGCAFLYSSELVPTNIRNLSMGIASMWGRVGSIISPFIVDLLGEIYYSIPSTFFGVMTLLAAGLTLLLPETGFTALPESVQEIESLPR